MKMNLSCILILLHLLEACAELIFRHLMENQPLELSCPLQQDLGGLTSLHLYHRGAHGQTTLLSMAEGGDVRVAPGLRGRLQLCGGLDSQQVNMTISHLQLSDAGLYVWELRHRQDDGPDFITSAAKVFLHVEGAGMTCRCSSSYPPLLLTIFVAAGLIVLGLIWLATGRCLRARHQRQQPPTQIYEEMTRRQQSAAITQNTHEATSHLEEDDFPVYANPNIRRPQENYYACPRQLALKA